MKVQAWSPRNCSRRLRAIAVVVLLALFLFFQLCTKRYMFASATSRYPILVYGLFTTVNGTQERIVHRQTWMQSPWVCNNRQSDHNMIFQPTQPARPCVQVYFVTGRLNQRESEQINMENSTYGDIISLDIHENMDDGKTPEWFRFAAKRYSHARFVGKGDMDTYVRADRLIPELLAVPDSQRGVYGGRPNDFNACGKWKWCPIGWIYMSGGFYFLSQDLVQWVGDPANAIVQRNYKGKEGEDYYIGRSLRESGQRLMYMVWPTDGEPWNHFVKKNNMSLFYDLYNGIYQYPTEYTVLPQLSD